MHKFSNEIIAKRREYLLEKQSNESNESVAKDDDIGTNKKEVFLDILLQSTIDGRPLSNAEILEETDTFLFAVNFIKKKFIADIPINFVCLLGSRYHHS